MIKTLKEILDVKLYSCELLIQSSTQINKVDLYNTIRGIDNVVTLTTRHSNFLNSKKTKDREWSLVYIKFISNGDVIYDLKKIKKDSIKKSEKSIFKFIFRSKTLKKK